MSLPPLKVRIGADVSDLQGGLQRAGRLVRGFSVAAVAGLAAVTAGLAAMTSQGLAAVDANAKLARSMDATVNGLRAVQLAGADAGVSLGEVNTAAQQMNRELARAAQGTGPAADALKRLGVNAETLQRLDVDKRLALIADRAKDLGLSAGETSDIMRDLGVRSRNMALLLTEGGDAIRRAREEVTEFGLELTGTQTRAVERANDAISRMRLIFESLSQQLAVNVAPILEGIANRFNDFARSDEARAAVQRLAEAFGRLAEIIVSGDFLGVAISGLETIANVSASAAEAMVTLSQNVEVATVAAGGLAAAMIAIGGPLSLIVGLLGAAAVGLATWARRAKTAGDRGQDAADAAKALNAALGTFSDTASPAAARQARDLAKANLDIRESALAAAEAEIAKLEAMRADPDRLVGNVSGGKTALEARIETEQANLDKAKAVVAEARETFVQLSEIADRGAVRPRQRPIDGGAADPEDPEDPETTDIPGLGSAGAVQSQMQGRLDALLAGLQTEREAVEEWRAESMETLREARENELITEEEFRARKEQIEQQHQERMDQLQQRERRARMRTLGGLFGDLSSLMRTENEKLFKIGQAAAIANATVSGYQAAVDAWQKGMAIGGPPVAAAFTAASLAKTGALISQIASQSPSGSGGGSSGGGSGGGGGATQAAAPDPPTQTVIIDAPGMDLSSFVHMINKATKEGHSINLRQA